MQEKFDTSRHEWQRNNEFRKMRSGMISRVPGMIHRRARGPHHQKLKADR